jgi:hypothetical protein
VLETQPQRDAYYSRETKSGDKRLSDKRGTDLIVSLKQHHSAPLVACREIVARMVKLDRRDNVRWAEKAQRQSGQTSRSKGIGRTFCDVLHLAFVTKALGKAPWSRTGCSVTAVHISSV